MTVGSNNSPTSKSSILIIKLSMGAGGMLVQLGTTIFTAYSNTTSASASPESSTSTWNSSAPFVPQNMTQKLTVEGVCSGANVSFALQLTYSNGSTTTVRGGTPSGTGQSEVNLDIASDVTTVNVTAYNATFEAPAAVVLYYDATVMPWKVKSGAGPNCTLFAVSRRNRLSAFVSADCFCAAIHPGILLSLLSSLQAINPAEHFSGNKGHSELRGIVKSISYATSCPVNRPQLISAPVSSSHKPPGLLTSVQSPCGTPVPNQVKYISRCRARKLACQISADPMLCPRS